MEQQGSGAGGRARVLLASLLVPLAVACAGPTGVRPADVAVYQKTPSRAYEFVATVRTQQAAPTRNEALADLRERAAEVGANAVIVSGRGESTGPLRGIAIRVQR
jgi:hypothetical protein